MTYRIPFNRLYLSATEFEYVREAIMNRLGDNNGGVEAVTRSCTQFGDCLPADAVNVARSNMRVAQLPTNRMYDTPSTAGALPNVRQNPFRCGRDSGREPVKK